MPTYEYVCENSKCKNYGNGIEIVKSLSQIDNEELCEQCSSVMKRILSNAGINLGKIGGGYNFQERSMGFGKKDKHTSMQEDKVLGYGYKCTNETCDQFDEYVTIYKKMSKSDKKEKCKSCKKVMIRVFNCSYMWGKGSRPDSDRRREQMCDALQRDDFTKIAELQTNFDSAGRSYFAKENKDEGNKKYKIIDKDLTLDYQYKCGNFKCKELDKIVIVTKSSKLSGREEFCEKCSKQLIKVF